MSQPNPPALNNTDSQEKAVVNEFMFLFATFVVIIAGLKAAESLVVPFLLSVFIAVICAPMLAWLKHKRIPDGLAIIIIIVGVLSSGLLLASLIGSSLNSFSQQIPSYQARLASTTGSLQQNLSQLGITLPEHIFQDLFNPGLAMKLAAQMFSALSNVMANSFMILLTVIFLLGEMAVFKSKLLSVSKQQQATSQTLDRFIGSINQYMAIKGWISLLTGFIAGLWCWIIGVDYPLLWGVLAFLLNFVPTLGSILAGIPPVLLALVQLGTTEALLITSGYIAINVIIGNVLEPRFMGKGLNLSTLVVFLSLVFWGWVLGPVGMLLSIPLTMGVKIGLETRPETRWIGVMLGASAPQAAVSDGAIANTTQTDSAEPAKD